MVYDNRHNLFSGLDEESQNLIIAEAIVMFPQIFSDSNVKYNEVALWLSEAKGIVSTSLRDMFSSSGRVDLTVQGETFHNMPRVYYHVVTNAEAIKSCINGKSDKGLSNNWKTEIKGDKLLAWLDLIGKYTKKSEKINNMLTLLFLPAEDSRV